MPDSKKLCSDEQDMLYNVQAKYGFLFDVTPGTCKNDHIDIELQPGAKPYYSKTYLVPRAHKSTFKREVERLRQLGLLQKVNRSEW